MSMQKVKVEGQGHRGHKNDVWNAEIPSAA